MKIDKQSRGEVIMNKKVQLNDMELNQVAGGGMKNSYLVHLIPKFPVERLPLPGKPVRPIFDK